MTDDVPGGNIILKEQDQETRIVPAACFFFINVLGNVTSTHSAAGATVAISANIFSESVQ